MSICGACLAGWDALAAADNLLLQWRLQSDLPWGFGDPCRRVVEGHGHGNGIVGCVQQLLTMCLVVEHAHHQTVTVPIHHSPR